MSAPLPQSSQRFEFIVSGMHCAGCTARLQRALDADPLVERAQVDLLSRQLVVQAHYHSPEPLLKRVQELGFSADCTYPTTGSADDEMGEPPATSDAKDEARPVFVMLEAAQIPSSRSADAPAHAKAVAMSPAAPLPASEAVQASKGEGLRVASELERLLRQNDQSHAVQLREQARLKRDVWLSAGLGLPVMLLSMLADMSSLLGVIETATIGGRNALQLALMLGSAVVLFGPGWRFLHNAWQLGKRGSASMDTLVSVGTLAAFVFSSWVTLWPQSLPTPERHVYFESVVVIIALVLLGRWLEGRARGATRDATRKLLALQPVSAHRLESDGSLTDLHPSQLRAGELLRVKAGETIPADGVVRDGGGSIDVSMLTGESMPVSVQREARVYSGSVLLDGSFLLQVERVGDDATLARIARRLHEAQASRAPVQRLVDRVATVFVPVVLLVALLAALLWFVFGPEPALAHALTVAMSVLLIACPCALGLATPAAISVGAGAAARRGILFRDASAIERLAACDTVVFDKTGTLSKGKPQVLSHRILQYGDALDEARLIRWIASLEQGSQHPLARALLAWAEARPDAGLGLFEVQAFQELGGVGVSGVVEGRRLQVVRAELKLLDDPGLSEAATLAFERGHTVLAVMLDGAARAVVELSDALREDALESVLRLKAMGIRSLLLSGDAEAVTQQVARSLGLDEARGQCSPHEKAAFVEQLRAQGRVVVFLGDGINDAPALATADVGAAMGSGADIAIESADLSLARSQPSALVEAIALARQTRATIRQNLVFAFVYNSLGIPIAAGALFAVTGTLLSPMLAALAMAASSLSVLGNSLRLARRARAIP
ncbi:MAG: heavy metal translocating P-type ATPase [Myxococcota bacterium]|nr:heavy metal translocating P-type ATPase [Myxococcota bacterium]